MVRLSLLKKPPSLSRDTVPQEGNLRVMFEAVETQSLFFGGVICGAAHNALGVRRADDGHMRNGTAVEADGVEMSGVIGVTDGVGIPFFVDTEGAEGGSRHSECLMRLDLSQSYRIGRTNCCE